MLLSIPLGCTRISIRSDDISKLTRRLDVSCLSVFLQCNCSVQQNATSTIGAEEATWEVNSPREKGQ